MNACQKRIAPQPTPSTAPKRSFASEAIRIAHTQRKPYSRIKSTLPPKPRHQAAVTFAETNVTTIGETIVGAGVSTCAPQ